MREMSVGSNVQLIRPIEDRYYDGVFSPDLLKGGSIGKVVELREKAATANYSDTTIILDGVAWEVNRTYDLRLI